MQKLSDLAKRPDFRVGPLFVSPARRRIEGPGGRADLEPLIMQVFLLLIDAPGEVVTRNTLFDQVWGGAAVGDDSLNRAVARVRRIDSEVGPGLFEIETIPRTGYRLIGDIVAAEGNASAARSDQRGEFRLSRRMMIGTAGVAGAAAAAGLGLWLVRGTEQDRKFAQLMDGAEYQFLHASRSSSDKAVEHLRAAVELRPGNAKAWGLLALGNSLIAERGQPGESGASVLAAERAALQALAIDANEPNARLAQVILQRSMLDFASTEDRLRQILAADPRNINVMRQLWHLLTSAGRPGDASELVDQAITIEPLAAGSQFPRAQLLWILGRNAEADRVIDRAMRFWPEHQWVRFAQFTIFAFTGRPRAALAMLEDEPGKAPLYGAPATALWRVSLAAIEDRSAARIATAREANLQAAQMNPDLSSQAILVLSALGEVDAAFEVANRLFLFTRPVEPGARSPSGYGAVRSTSWRFTPWLFTPPVAEVRADPRFQTLCEGIGLTEYWAKRGVRPDYQLRPA